MNPRQEPLAEASCLYLYGFTKPLRDQALDLIGLDGRVPVLSLDFGPISALYSELPLTEFEALLSASDPPDPEWVVPRACRHEQILEAVMQRVTVLPTRFGAVFASTDSLARFLSEHSKTILQFLNEASGKQEWTLKLTMDLDRTTEQLLRTEPQFVQQFTRLSKSPGTRYFEEKRLRSKARDSAKVAGSQLAQRLAEALLRHSWEVRRLSHPANSERLPETLVRLAVLIPATDVELLDAQVAELLRSPDAAGLSLQKTGPWPPSHFCPTLEVTAP